MDSDENPRQYSQH
jgi:hypothetical protein